MTSEQHACHGIRWAGFETRGWRWHRPSGAIPKQILINTVCNRCQQFWLTGRRTGIYDKTASRSKNIRFFAQPSLLSVPTMQWIQHYRIYTHPKLILCATGSVKLAFICTVTVRITCSQSSQWVPRPLTYACPFSRQDWFNMLWNLISHLNKGNKNEICLSFSNVFSCFQKPTRLVCY